MPYTTCTVPQGEKIAISSGKLQVPANPIVPFIRGDGTGPDIWSASERVFDAAVAKAYGGARKVASSAWQLRDYSLPAPAAPAVAAGAPSPAALK